MKKLIIIIGVVIVLILGAYYGMGLVTERSLNKVIQDAQSMQGAKLEVVQYKRGLFCSTVLLNGVVPNFIPDSQASQMMTVPVTLTVHHGPVMFINQSVRFGLGLAKGAVSIPEEYQAQVKKMLSAASTLPAVDVEVLINFMNHAHIVIGIQPFQLMAQSGDSQFSWLGFNNTVNLSMNLNQVMGRSQLEGIQLNHHQKQVTLGQVESQFTLKKSVFDLYEGKANLVVSDLKVSQRSQEEAYLKDLSVSTDSEIQSGLVDSHFVGELAQLKLGNQDYGPGKLVLALNHLDAQVLGRIKQTLQSVQGSSIMGRQRALIGIIPELPRLLMRGASFSISEFYFNLPDGKIEATLTLSAPDAANLTNPFQLIAKMNGQGHVSAPVTVIRQLITDAYRQKMQYQSVVPSASQSTVSAGDLDTEAQVKQLVDKRFETLLAAGALVQQGNNYILDLKLDKGSVVVNGKPFVPAMLEF